jgi:hypothetical protein
MQELGSSKPKTGLKSEFDPVPHSECPENQNRRYAVSSHRRAQQNGGKSQKARAPHRNAQKGNWTGTENAQKRAQKNGLHRPHRFPGLMESCLGVCDCDGFCFCWSLRSKISRSVAISPTEQLSKSQLPQVQELARRRLVPYTSFVTAIGNAE